MLEWQNKEKLAVVSARLTITIASSGTRSKKHGIRHFGASISIVSWTDSGVIASHSFGQTSHANYAVPHKQ